MVIIQSYAQKNSALAWCAMAGRPGLMSLRFQAETAEALVELGDLPTSVHQASSATGPGGM